MSFPEAGVKEFIRTECLREENGQPRTKPSRMLRMLALIKEGDAEDAPPLWSREFEDGENDEDSIDVDGITGRIRKKVNDEVNQKAATVMFRLIAIHGTEATISPSAVTAQFPFTVHPTRRIVREQAGGDDSPYQTSFGDASEKGLAALFMRGMKMSQEIYFPEISNLIDEKNTTIDDLRSALRDANDTIRDLRAKLDEAEDKRVERTIKLRDAALKQRLKEKGGRLVMNTLTMLASSYVANRTPPSMGGPGGPPREPPLPPQAPNKPIAGGDGPAPEGGTPAGAEGAEGAPPAEAAPPPPPQVDIVQASVQAFKSNRPVDLDALFGALVEELAPHIGQLGFAVTPDQTAMLIQMATIYQQHGRADRLLIQRFAEDLGEDGTDAALRKLMQHLPSDRSRAAFAVVLAVAKNVYDAQVDEDRELERDLGERVDRNTSGEIENAEPEVPDDLISPIKVTTPKLLTKKEAEERRKKDREKGGAIVVKAVTPNKKRPL